MNESGDIREPTTVCDVLDSLAISGTPESTGVMTFVQEACTQVSAVSTEYSKTVYPVQPTLQDVREYFSRPVAVASGTLTLGTRGYVTGGIPSFAQILNYWANGQTRLTGAYGIRATVVYTLQIAATPFHQGLVCLSWQYGVIPGVTGVYNRLVDACTTTNLPHVVLDLSSDSMVQLKVPFLYPGEYCTVGGFETTYGNWGISNLVPCPAVTGMGAPTYQVYCHLEDIELFGSTPQATTNVVFQAGRVVKSNPVATEFYNAAYPFSSGLHAVGQAVGFIAKNVPSLSTVGGVAAWAIDKAAGVARYFGYGKPQVVEPLSRMFVQDTVGEFNTDVATASMVMAATATNSTAITTTVGASDVDEMSLAYVVSRWSQINEFSYGTSSASGTLLYAGIVSPLAMYFRSTGTLPALNRMVPQFSTATTNSIQPSHVMFAASCFKQWRGGFKYRFTFAKTKMHAGRVMVVFNPLFSTGTNTTAMSTPLTVPVAVFGTYGPDPFAYSAIFDLKDGNVFEFKVPYVASAPYANSTAYIGTVALYVVNPLIAPSVVSSTISVLVEVAGDSDFELGNPAGIMFPVHNAGTINIQAGRIISEAPEVVNQHTMGEAITSVKQLISIPHTCIWGGGVDTEVSGTIPPWYYTPNYSATVPANNTALHLSFSYGGAWASCYSFLKGGTDLHVYDTDNALTLGLSQYGNSGAFIPTTATPDNRGNSNVPFLLTTKYALHARLPSFFPTSRVFSWIANAITVAGSSWLEVNPYTSTTSVTPFTGIQAIWLLTCVPHNLDSSGVAVQVNRNAADDAQLAMYIGPPPIWLPNSSTTGVFDPDTITP